VLAEHQWIIAQYPEAAQIDVWGEDPLAVASSSLAPREAARRVPGGWRALPVLERLRLCAVGDHRHLSRQEGRPAYRAWWLWAESEAVHMAVAAGQS
jgi:hypothetical protein